MEENLNNLTNAGQRDMSNPVTSAGGRIKSGSTVSDRERQPSVQLLQRGYIIGTENGGPIDVSEIVTGTSENETVMKSQLTQLFKSMGNLFYGKKVYVEGNGFGHNKYYYYSRGSNASSFSDDSWKVIE